MGRSESSILVQVQPAGQLLHNPAFGASYCRTFHHLPSLFAVSAAGFGQCVDGDAVSGDSTRKVHG
jgi:hypothetical protein